MTNTVFTQSIIDGYRMENNTINVEYFVDNVYITCNNTEYLYKEARNTKKTISSVAKNWICSFVNIMLKYNGYNGYVCTYPQIRKALANQLEEIEKAVAEYVEAVRNEE